MIRRPPRSTLDRSSAASDVYKRQELLGKVFENLLASYNPETQTTARKQTGSFYTPRAVSYTHLRAHETVLDIV